MDISIISPIKQYAYGTATPTASLTLTFNIPHGLGVVPNFANVSPKNTLSAAIFTVTWDATNIIVTYLGALTGAMSLGWVALV